MPISRKTLDSLPSYEDTRAELLADPEQRALYEQLRIDAAIGDSIRQARLDAGLTQKALAEAIGTSHSVISRMENADYDGHTMKMLYKIALALGCSLEVRMEPRESA